MTLLLNQEHANDSPLKWSIPCQITIIPRHIEMMRWDRIIHEEEAGTETNKTRSKG